MSDGESSRTCIFCGGAPLTAEHVWPNWARRMLPSDVTAECTVRAETPAGTTSKTFPERVFDQRVKVVCAACNNNWMSRLEMANRTFLQAALEGRGRTLHREGQRELAAWAFKTALVINSGLFRAHRTGTSPAHARHLLDTGEPPLDVGIWLTTVAADEPGHVVSTGLALGARDEVASDDDPPNFSIVTFSFGPLAFQVATAVDPDRIGVVPADIVFPWPVIHRLWPYRRSFTWSQSPVLDQRQFDQFANRIREELQRLVGP